MKASRRFSARTRLGIAFLLVGSALMGLSSRAWAVTTCTVSVQTVTLTMPIAVTVPRDALGGTPLTAWAQTPAMENWYMCSSTVQQAVGVGVFPLGLELSATTIVDAGVTYPVYKTDLPGVGIAMGRRIFMNGCGWETAWSEVSSLKGAAACNSHELLPNGAQFRARLVKIDDISSGVVSAGPVAQGRLYANAAYDPRAVIISTTATQVTVLSCLTPDVLVDLRSHKSSELKGPGSFTEMTPFNVALKSCPAGINRVTYQVDAVTPIVDVADSVVALDSGSTATGVGVQLLDGAGNVFPLGTVKTLAGYSTSQGGDYDVKFNARYYQTGAAVGPGSANTAMTFTMSYE